MARVEAMLKDAKLPHEGVYFDTLDANSTVRARFADTDTQLKAKDALQTRAQPRRRRSGLHRRAEPDLATRRAG